MKCENCGKNEVTFVYQSNVNGHVTEKHLCADCAEKLGYTQQIAARSQRMMKSFNSFFNGGLFDDFFSPRPFLLDRMRGMLEDPFDDFFADMPALGAPAEKQEQTSSPAEQEQQSRFAEMRKLNVLRADLKKAVRQEEYERAAELRDQIRAMEAQQSKRQ